MVCSHCNQAGHTYRTCPSMTEEQKKAKAEEIKKKKEETAQRREQRRQRNAERQRVQDELQRRKNLPISKYTVSNPMDYEVVIYWTFSKPDYGNIYRARALTYCGSHTSVTISCKKELHRLIMIPFLEVTIPGRVDAMQSIMISENGELQQKTVFDMNMQEYDGTEIIIDQEYTPPKSEMDLWKECALKSKYLLDQIYMLTGGLDKDGNVSKEEFENIAPVLDMIQDISIPSTCTEIDKERAGVPSGLTNIT